MRNCLVPAASADSGPDRGLNRRRKADRPEPGAAFPGVGAGYAARRLVATRQSGEEPLRRRILRPLHQLVLLVPQDHPEPVDVEREDGEADRQLEPVRATTPHPVQTRLLIADSTPECFRRAVAKAGSASRAFSSEDSLPFVGWASNSKSASSLRRFSGLWKPRSKLDPEYRGTPPGISRSAGPRRQYRRPST